MADLLKKLNLNGTEYELGMSSAERAKFESIEAQAQVNKLEGVQVDGTDLAITGKKVNIDLATPIADAVGAAKTELSGTISGIDGRLSTVEGSYATTDNVATAKGEAIAAGAVTIAEAAGTGNVLKTYTFTQNGAEIGTINLAKDLVVSGGEVVEKDGVKYLSLSIANQETPVEIPVTDLVDVYTGSTYIEISASNEISVKFAELDAALAAETATVGAAIKAADAKGAQGISDAAAAKTAADNAQAHSEGVRTDLGNKTDEASATGSAFARIAQLKADLGALSGDGGTVSEQINAAISSYDTATVQPLAGKVTANETKLSGISEGANKVTMSVESDTLKVTIA